MRIDQNAVCHAARSQVMQTDNTWRIVDHTANRFDFFRVRAFINKLFQRAVGELPTHFNDQSPDNGCGQQIGINKAH